MIVNETYKLGFKEIPSLLNNYIIEYVLAKITILCMVIIMKYFSFYAAKSFVENGWISKICIAICGRRHFFDQISNFRKLKYGPRLKLGVPGMAGKKHKKTGIQFDKMGFPKFNAFYTVKLKKGQNRKEREYHFYHSSKALYSEAMHNSRLKSKFTPKELEMFKQGKVPKKFTWHHHQNNGVMQLVDFKIHSEVSHIGGFSIWGKK